MAILIKVDGSKTNITIPKKNQLEFLQGLVGGYIEIVGIKAYKGHTGMVINEEGKLNELPFNLEASKIFNNPYDAIVGDAILFKDGEVD